jgi:polysaccharide biosynthesis protein PelA
MFRGVSVRLCVGQRVGPGLAKGISCAVALLSSGWAAAGPTTGFYFGPNPPIPSLAAFDRVVVDPDQTTDLQARALADEGVEVFGRLAVGEVADGRPWFATAPPEWKLGRGSDGKSAIVDPAQTGLRQLLFEQARLLHARGYQGLLLEGLDRYREVLPSEAERSRRADAWVAWLTDLRRQLPGCKLLLEGGFSLFPRAHPLAAGLVARSLFSRWDPASGRSVDVPAADRDRLLDRLRAVRAGGDLPITVIDQVAPGDRLRARSVAARIDGLGFEPWVGPPELDRLGLGRIEVVPRRALVVYDSTEAPLTSSSAHGLLALPLEYFGLAVDYLDAAGPLPPGRLEDQYAGIVTVLTDDAIASPGAYRAWLVRQLDAGLRVVRVGRPGFPLDPALLVRLGLQMAGTGELPAPVKIAHRDGAVGFEAEPVTRGGELLALRIRPGAPGMTAHLELVDGQGGRVHPVLSAPWGGLAQNPFVVQPGLEGRTRWILNPFWFLERALALPARPVLDTTTENGRRIFTSHIDGDGFVNMSERPDRKLGGEVILEEILRRYPVPTAVSVIEGEIGATGLYRESSPKLEGIAREIFRLPHVEAASHAYSHPFDWDAAEHHRAATEHEAAHLPLPNYTFDLEREIAGSVAYIDRRLLPPGKRTRLFLWSGSAQPSARAVAVTRRLGLLNVNGASVGTIGQGVTSLTHVSCLGRPLDGGYQVYAPHPNENNFTNLWRGPYYGYRRAVDVFQHTEQPLRVKPISLYYHFYSGAKPAGVAALRTVHDWALAQEIIPIRLSDYAVKVIDFQRATLARTLEGGWELRRLSSLRTVRFDERLGWPVLEGDSPVVVVRGLPQGRYASFAPAERVQIRFRPEPPQVPYLVWANGQAIAQQRGSGELKLRVVGEVPLRMALAGCPRGAPAVAADGIQLSGGAAQVEVTFAGKESGDVVVTCP